MYGALALSKTTGVPNDMLVPETVAKQRGNSRLVDYDFDPKASAFNPDYNPRENYPSPQEFIIDIYKNILNMNIDENTLLKMLNPKYKDLFELVAKRGIDEIQRDNPELIEQIKEEVRIQKVNQQLSRLADMGEADADDMFGGDGF